MTVPLIISLCVFMVLWGGGFALLSKPSTLRDEIIVGVASAIMVAIAAVIAGICFYLHLRMP